MTPDTGKAFLELNFHVDPVSKVSALSDPTREHIFAHSMKFSPTDIEYFH